MEILALIPARGGFKGVPRKNICIVAGKPLIAYSIEQALSSRFITRVIVSTDDKEIVEIARSLGAEVPFMRPREYAQDLSPDIDVFIHALTWLMDFESYQPEVIVHLRPTCPVRRVEVIDQAIEEFLNHPEADSLRSVSWPLQTPYKMWRIIDGYLAPLLRVEGLREPYNMPRQLLPEVFWQNGYVDITRPRTILEMGMMNGHKILPFVIKEEWVDIDYEESLEKAEDLLLRRRQGFQQTTPARKRYPS